jgi:hypothetical protein
VELLYKRMKQVLRLNQLRNKRPAANEATILALLVAWALQEQESQQARTLLAQAAAELSPPEDALPSSEPGTPEDALPPVSSWVLTAVCLHTLRQVTQGYWNLPRLYACLPHLQRFLRGSPRQRGQQEHLIRVLLNEVMGTDPCWHPPSFHCSSA